MATKFEKLAAFIGSLPASQSVYIPGRPGTGKTALSNTVAKFTPPDPEAPTEPIMTVTWDLGGRLPEDILGLPFREDDYTFYAPPMELAIFSKRNRRGVFILDDLPNTEKMVQKAVYRLVAERRVGSLELSREVRIIATGNRREDESGASVLPAALRNRFMILEYEPDLDGWIKWCLEQGYSIDVPAFLKFKPEHFSKYPKDADSKGAFATPRQWEGVCKSLDVLQKHKMVFEGTSGLVGEGVAHEFSAFNAIKDKLPPADSILEDPAKAVPSIPTDIDVLLSMMSMIAAEAAKKKKKQEMAGKFISAVAYLTQGAREYAGVAIDVYSSAGGNVTELSVYIRNNMQKEPLLKNLLSHMQSAVKIE